LRLGSPALERTADQTAQPWSLSTDGNWDDPPVDEEPCRLAVRGASWWPASRSRRGLERAGWSATGPAVYASSVGACVLKCVNSIARCRF